ncbi:MAG: plasmid pRiA4b ORF-3 family protein [Desulfatibacillum sp.]|nr:plasmid pRiA4b ORF-3 family protein [Desulfatibacillum sp.]
MFSGKKVTDLRRLYCLRITLMGSDPAIWRRIVVTSDTTLGKMHQIILAVMGWSGTHQHRFSIGGRSYGIPTPDHDFGLLSEQEVRLSHVAPNLGKRFIYEYDPGDNWRHEILVEEISPLEKNLRNPVCVDGERACPPENIGGIFRYIDFLEALRDERHPAHAVMVQWVGQDFDPGLFDIDAANTRLSRIA